MKLLGIYSLLLTLLVLGSCKETSNKANVLPPDIQYTADTMFSHRRNLIIQEMDSLCASSFEQMVQRKADSIVALEQERIKKITGE